MVLVGRGVRLDQRTVEVSDHLCECGCGRFTMVSPKTRTERGWVKGQPRRYCYGHGAGHAPRTSRESRYFLRVYYVRARKPGKWPGHVVEDRGFETPCWIWQGSVDKHGYGRISRGWGKAKAHREAYEAGVGAIPAGCDVHHRCEVKLCVNPEHLQALTAEEHGQLHGEVWRRAARG